MQSLIRETLLQKSMDVILQNQSQWGSYPASPTFPQFRYSWLRDGTFIAHAAMISGHAESAKAFYTWVHNTILKNKHIIDSLPEKMAKDIPLTGDDFLPARFTMDGEIEQSKISEPPFFFNRWPEIYSLGWIESGNEWPNFQTDCYGTWLWGIASYAKFTGDTTFIWDCKESIDLTITYLQTTWQLPCFDPWEEYGSKNGISTMGSIAGGLIAINEFWGDNKITLLINEIKSTLIKSITKDGYLPKYVGSEMIDGSALWLIIPYNVFAFDDPITKATIQKIEEDLLIGGVKRYLNDVYYGGGEWIILTCWLAWYYIHIGEHKKANQLLTWCEDHTEDGLSFPEQSLENLNFPDAQIEWETNWWPESPAPLLWSHAMYLIVIHELKQKLEGK